MNAQVDVFVCHASQDKDSFVRPLAEALELAVSVRAMFTGQPVDIEKLGDLEALQGVKRYPIRIKCATLAWNALQVGAQRDAEDEEVYSDEAGV